MLDLIGIIVGHLYYFLVYRYPEDFGGQEWIRTPSIFYSYFPNSPGRGAFIRFDTRPQNQPTAGSNRGGHSWGSGSVLGNN